MPDLCRRLTVDDICPKKTVDLVPMNGSDGCMATRAATATILDMLPCKCPSGTVPKTSKQTKRRNRNASMIQAGDGSCVIEIVVIHSPGFIVPGYVNETNDEPISLGDIGKCKIVVPIAMLREHDKSNASRATPVEDSTPVSKSKPASTSSKRIPSKRLKRPMTNDFDYTSVVSRRPLDTDIIEILEEDDFRDDVSELDVDDEDLGGLDDNSPEEWKEEMKGLTSEDISRLHDAIFQSESAKNGNLPLLCKGLTEPPKPQDIMDRFSAVLGDVFHAMNCTRVPVRHEAKKAYFVALKNAFLIWNTTTLEQLEDKMREGGMSDKEVEAQRYYNSQVYTRCVERHAPSPRILYWRVRAVYALYGNMIDSKSGKPLFNVEAWNKADNVLKEIMCGFYSDPPGFEMYSKRLRNGKVMKNKYGMDMIECCRGTNRTEAYHKQLVTTFGSWHTGVEMSDCLLAERRHRHNHTVAEMRRYGFPKYGHKNTWKIDQYQNLYLANHGCQLYPHWTNASDYKCTDESFDTVALHDDELHKALEKEFAPNNSQDNLIPAAARLNLKNIKLT